MKFRIISVEKQQKEKRILKGELCKQCKVTITLWDCEHIEILGTVWKIRKLLLNKMISFSLLCYYLHTPMPSILQTMHPLFSHTISWAFPSDSPAVIMHYRSTQCYEKVGLANRRFWRAAQLIHQSGTTRLKRSFQNDSSIESLLRKTLYKVATLKLLLESTQKLLISSWGCDNTSMKKGPNWTCVKSLL